MDRLIGYRGAVGGAVCHQLAFLTVFDGFLSFSIMSVKVFTLSICLQLHVMSIQTAPRSSAELIGYVCLYYRVQNKQLHWIYSENR